MVDISEDPSHKTKRILNNAIMNIKSCIEPDYELSNVVYSSSNVYADLYKITTTEKKRWLSDKKYLHKEHIKLGWVGYQEGYGVYLNDVNKNDIMEVAGLIEKTGFKVTVWVKEEI